MKQLENRIKDRLEGYESSLPEGDLAEFKALLDASATAGTKRSQEYLAWLAPVAVAAGLALFFGLKHDSQHGVFHMVDSNSMVADVSPISSAEVGGLAETEPVEDVAAIQTNIQRIINRPDAPAAVSTEPEDKESASDVSEQNAPDQIGRNQQKSRTGQKGGEKRKDESPSVCSAGHPPFIPSGISNWKPVSVKVGRATAGVLGGTGALALASVLPSIMKRYDNGDMPYHADDLGGIYTDPEPLIDGRTMNDTHYLPLRAGLSMRIPFNERWSLTTGLDYSWYASELEHSLSGIHKQSVHYLGIPLRADFTIARNKWMDVYVGAGGSMDYCVAAYDAGQKIAKDGMGFSLIGAGGIQFNINKNLGLFLDPTFSWNIPSDNRVLDTYKTKHPFLFTTSTGLRITFPNRKATADQLAMGSF